MDNMAIYNKVRVVPENAKKKITGGRLNGMTDISPIWRIKTLTELFGPCGTGWYVQVADKRIEKGADDLLVAIVELNLFYKMESGEWSAPVYGVGGSMFVDMQKGKLYTSDEAFKMATTDALSVCCKMLGMGADVYWEADRTKYSDGRIAAEPAAPRNDNHPKLICQHCGKEITGKRFKGQEYTPFQIAQSTSKKYGEMLCWSCSKEVAAQEQSAPHSDNDAPPAGGEIPPWEAQG